MGVKTILGNLRSMYYHYATIFAQSYPSRMGISLLSVFL